MSKRESLLDSMERAEADHELLTTYIECFHRMFGHASPRVVRQASAAARLFINRKIVDHFAFEERHLLPALLRANPGDDIVRGVTKLRKEHQSLLMEAKRLDKLLADETGPYNQRRRLRQAMTHFFRRMEQHAAKENELFPSLL